MNFNSNNNFLSLSGRALDKYIGLS